MRLLLAARLSSKPANGEQGIGIETQDERSRVWAEQAGHDVIAVAAGTVKGTVSPWNRRYLKTWLTDPERRAEYDGILCFATDRLSRGDQEEFVRIEAWATEHAKKLVIASGQAGIMYPARDDSDYYQWNSEKRQANRELESIRERSMRAQAKLKDGGHLVGRYPWGYASEGPKYARQMVTTAEGGRLIPELYARVAAGESLDTAAAWLTAETGRRWWGRSLAATIRNPTYRGAHQDASGRTIHACPALVEGDVWRAAVAALDARPANRRGRRTDLAAGAILSGAVMCGNPACDATGAPESPMYKIIPPGQSTPYYRCSGRGAQRKGCGCMVPLAAADALMDAAMGGLRMPVTRPVVHPATGHQAELDDIAQALRDLPAQGLDDDAEDAERARLRAARKAIPAGAIPAWTEQVETGETYGAKWARSTPAERKAWLREAGFAAYLGRPEMVTDAPEDDGHPGEVSTRIDLWENEHAALAFVWDGDSDPGLARGLA